MRPWFLAWILIVSVSAQMAFGDSFPTTPAASLTPGALCTTPDEYRYPEHIPYCNRNVTEDTKNQIIATYDRTFGYRIEQMPRSQFKIDHFIPLCAGGANSVDNLWPQHMSVYTITDPLEQLLCDKMAAGKLLQKDAVNYMKDAKLHLDKAPSIIHEVNSL